MGAVFALARKDLRILFRIRSGIFFTCVWPLLIAVFFGLIFSGSAGSRGKLKVSLVDEDQTDGSRQFAARLEQGGHFDLDRVTREEAASLVRQGKRTAFIVLPRGFGEASARLFYGEPPAVEVGIDPSRKAETAMLEGLLFQHAAEGMQSVLSDPTASRTMVQRALKDLEGTADAERASLGRFLGELGRFLAEPVPPQERRRSAGWTPLAINATDITVARRGPQNTFSVTFPQGIVWALIGCVMTFGIGIVTERTQGTLLRLQTSPLTRAQLLAGKALACLGAIALVEIGMFVLARVVFGVRPASIGLLVLACVSSGVAFVGIMMLTSALGKTEQAASGAGWAVIMPLAMVGGAMVPLFVMPAWMTKVSYVSPVRWTILALEGAIWRDFSLAEMLLPCAILIGVGAVCFTIGTRAFRGV